MCHTGWGYPKPKPACSIFRSRTLSISMSFQRARVPRLDLSSWMILFCVSSELHVNIVEVLRALCGSIHNPLLLMSMWCGIHFLVSSCGIHVSEIELRLRVLGQGRGCMQGTPEYVGHCHAVRSCIVIYKIRWLLNL